MLVLLLRAAAPGSLSGSTTKVRGIDLEQPQLTCKPCCSRRGHHGRRAEWPYATLYPLFSFLDHGCGQLAPTTSIESRSRVFYPSRSATASSEIATTDCSECIREICDPAIHDLWLPSCECSGQSPRTWADIRIRTTDS